MPIFLKIAVALSILRILVIVVFSVLLIVFVSYNPDSGALAQFRPRLVERLLGSGVTDFSYGEAIVASLYIGIGALFQIPLVLAAFKKTKKLVLAAKIGLVLLFLFDLIRIRIYSIPLDLVAWFLFNSKKSKAYLEDSPTDPES